MPADIHLIEVALLVFILNIPFGYWRNNVKKFSLQWILAIHIPVPLVIAVRFMADIGFHWSTYPLLIGAYFAGQFAGGRIHRYLKKKQEVSSCLVMDLYRYIK